MIAVLFLLTVCVPALGDPEPRTVSLNIGGSQFTTTPATINRYPDSRLALNYRPDKSLYFYDRDGDMFRHVLNYLRSGKLLLPRNFDQLALLREEAKYFNLYMLHDEIVELQKEEKKKEVLSAPRGLPENLHNRHSPADVPVPVYDNTTDDKYECVILCADEDGKVERWFSAPVDLRFENNGCLLGNCEVVSGFSHILDYRDYTARPGNTVPDHFNIAAIVAKLLRAGFHLSSSSSGMDQWHRQFYFVFVRRIKKAQP